MNLDRFAPFHGHNLPAMIGFLVGLGCLWLVFKVGKFVARVVLCLIAAVLFAGAYWWITHIQS